MTYNLEWRDRGSITPSSATASSTSAVFEATGSDGRSRTGFGAVNGDALSKRGGEEGPYPLTYNRDPPGNLSRSSIQFISTRQTGSTGYSSRCGTACCSRQ
jgi:hypothetical protein